MKNLKIFLTFITFLFLLIGNTANAEMRHSARVYMYDDYFSPSTIIIPRGQKVTWINMGHKHHTVTSDNGYFDSGKISPGASVSYTFYKPGTYNYSCTLHSFFIFGMKGKVIVR